MITDPLLLQIIVSKLVWQKTTFSVIMFICLLKNFRTHPTQSYRVGV